MAATDALAIAGLATSVGAGLMFATAGVAKLRHRTAFEGVVADYRLLPSPLVTPVVRVLPWAEIALAISLVAGLHPWAQRIAAALLLVFAAAMAINLGRGRAHIDCGCGLSALHRPLDRGAVARNVALALLLIGASAAGDVPGALAVAVAVVAGAALFLSFLIFKAIGALSRTSPAARGR